MSDQQDYQRALRNLRSVTGLDEADARALVADYLKPYGFDSPSGVNWLAERAALVIDHKAVVARFHIDLWQCAHCDTYATSDTRTCHECGSGSFRRVV